MFLTVFTSNELKNYKSYLELLKPFRNTYENYTFRNKCLKMFTLKLNSILLLFLNVKPYFANRIRVRRIPGQGGFGKKNKKSIKNCNKYCFCVFGKLHEKKDFVVRFFSKLLSVAPTRLKLLLGGRLPPKKKNKCPWGEACAPPPKRKKNNKHLSFRPPT